MVNEMQKYSKMNFDFQLGEIVENAVRVGHGFMDDCFLRKLRSSLYDNVLSRFDNFVFENYSMCDSVISESYPFIGELPEELRIEQSIEVVCNKPYFKQYFEVWDNNQLIEKVECSNGRVSEWDRFGSDDSFDTYVRILPSKFEGSLFKFKNNILIGGEELDWYDSDGGISLRYLKETITGKIGIVEYNTHSDPGNLCVVGLLKNKVYYSTPFSPALNLKEFPLDSFSRLNRIVGEKFPSQVGIPQFCEEFADLAFYK